MNKLNPLIPPETPKLINELVSQNVLPFIFGKLEAADLKTVLLVCKVWYEVGNNEKLWMNLAEDRFQKDVYCLRNNWVVNHRFKPKIDYRRFGSVFGNILPRLKIIAEMASSLEKCHEEFTELVVGVMIERLIYISDKKKSMPWEQYEKELPEFPCLEGYMNAPKYSFAYLNQGEVKKDPLVFLQLYLIKALESENPKVRESAVKAFKRVVLYSFQKYAPNNFNGITYVYESILRSLLRVYLETSPDLKKAANETVKIFQNDYDKLQNIVCGFHPGKLKRAMFKALVVWLAKFSELVSEPINWKKSILSIPHTRVFHAKQVYDLTKKLELISICSSFENNYEEFLKVSVKVLIALSQSKTVECFVEGSLLESISACYRQIYPAGTFKKLENYLNNVKYYYVLGNDKQTTSIFRIAAVLYIIRGLESDNLDVKNAALKSFEILANDYLTHGHKGEVAEQYLAAIFEIARGYVDAQTKVDSKTMCETIISTFRANKEILQKFTKALPKREKRSLLEEAISPLKEID